MSGLLHVPKQALARFLSVLSCIAVVSCSGAVRALPATAGAPSVPLARVPSFSLAAALAAQGRWLQRQTLADGAILYGTNEIEPYYANVAAAGEAGVPSELGRVRRWMGWYVAHLNAKDRWGLSGTVYDYRYDPATHAEVSLEKADSVDSYAATFMTLARTLYDTNDPVSQQYVKTLQAPLETMAAMLLQIRQPFLIGLASISRR